MTDNAATATTLRDAIRVLQSRTLLSRTTTTDAFNVVGILDRLAPLLAQALEDTATEYDEPNTSVCCDHCWNNVQIAYAILGTANPESTDD